MTISKLGIKKPEAVDNCYGVRGVYNPETGMSGGLMMDNLDPAKATEFYLYTEHEDVGLQTFYRAPSFEEANHFLDRLKAVEVEGA